jgi:hypothetical protein
LEKGLFYSEKALKFNMEELNKLKQPIILARKVSKSE